MDKYINFQRFLRYLLDDENLAEKGTMITRALLEAQSMTNPHDPMRGY